MVRSVIIARVHDGLPLAASMDDDELDRDFPEHKTQAKSILKGLSLQTEPMCTIETTSQYLFHILLGDGIGLLCICDKMYPKRLAFSFLTHLLQDFIAKYGTAKVEAARRPYEFIQFDATIQKCKRSYQDVRAKENLDRLQDELVDVAQVMQMNIRDVLERGTKIEKMSLLSSSLSQQSRQYVRDTKSLNWERLKRTYGPPVVVLVIVLVFLYIWIKWL